MRMNLITSFERVLSFLVFAQMRSENAKREAQPVGPLKMSRLHDSPDIDSYPPAGTSWKNFRPEKL